jgi:peroxiredoxin
MRPTRGAAAAPPRPTFVRPPPAGGRGSEGKVSPVVSHRRVLATLMSLAVFSHPIGGTAAGGHGPRGRAEAAEAEPMPSVRPTTSTTPISLGDPAPSLALADLSGKPLALADFRGQTLVVQFFATWCEPCHRAFADLQAVLAESNTAGATPSPRVLLISLRETREVVEARTAAAGMRGAASGTPPTVVAIDPDGAAAARWGARRLPTVFIVDGQGVVRHINRGWGPGYRARLRRWLSPP